jgi:hypothetical protein
MAEMTRLFHGEDATYYTQRNNVEVPGTACEWTALINVGADLGWDFPAGHGQPEDRFIRFVRSDQICRDRYKQLDPAGKYPIGEWLEVLALGFSRWMKIPELAHFYEETPAQVILDHLSSGGGCVVTGEFPLASGKTLHHGVGLLGADLAGDAVTENIVNWWIRDSWGDYRTGYENHDGRRIPMPDADFQRLLKKTGRDSKWCIFVEGKKED